MKAVILSAGQGKRLLPMTADRPKCLLPLLGRTVLEWQVRALASNGVQDILTVVGFGADKVERLVADLHVPGAYVRTLFNPFHPVSDNLASCFIARTAMTGDFILLNGDTLFEPGVLNSILARATAPITVAIDRKNSYDSDDMKVSIAGGRLTRIGKDLAGDAVHGELIGLILFRGSGASRFVGGVEAAMRSPDRLRSWYLSVIDDLARSGTVGVASIEGLHWSELDIPGDLRTAEAVVERWQHTVPARQEKFAEL